MGESAGESRRSDDRLREMLSRLVESGETGLVVRDSEFVGGRGRLLRFLEAALRLAPDVFYVLFVEPQVLDREVCSALSRLCCSVQLRLDSSADRRLLSRRVEILNRSGLVFGFDMDISCGRGDTVRLFRDRLDFAAGCHPNHIDFPQLERGALPSATPSYSARDIRLAAECAFACSVFYSAGRAVPWFLGALRPLRISPARFFSDFAEWLRCNNCSAASGFDPFGVPHEEVERMQLAFLQIKYEEKNAAHIFPVVREIVRLDGAFSRLAGEGVESELELDFSPDDLCSPGALDVAALADSVCMERCRVRVFSALDGDGQEFPDYRILG